MHVTHASLRERRVVYFFAAETACATRAFRRAAVRASMTPRFAALSIALYAVGRSAFAVSHEPSLTRVSSFFIVSRSAFLRRSLNTLRRFAARRAFFADEVMGIGTI